MALTQTKKNKAYKDKHQLTRIELLLTKVTQARYAEFKNSNPGTTANQLLTMLLDAYQVQADSNTGTSSDPVADQTDSNTGTASDPVVEPAEVVPDSTTGTASESIPQPQDISKDTVKAIAQRLLDQHGMNKADALKPTREAWKKLFPEWKCDCNTKSELQSKYNSLNDQMKAIVKKRAKVE